MKKLNLAIFCLFFVGCYYASQTEGDPDPLPPCSSDDECDDGVDCTLDICTLDGCVWIDECAEPTECSSDDECDDGVDCTVDYCAVTGICQHVDLCEDPECSSEIQTIQLPTPAVQMDVGISNAQIALAWRESSHDLSPGYFSVFSLPDPPEEAAAVLLGEAEGHGTHHIHLLWHEPNFRAFWSSFDGSASSIKMASISSAGTGITDPVTLYDAHHASLSEVVMHPSGELGIAWSDWAEPGANAMAYFGRFSLYGETLEILPIGETDYSYGPRLVATEEGYAMSYTDYEDLDGISDVKAREYSFSHGLGHSLRLNGDESNFYASAIAEMNDERLVLWHWAMTADIRSLYASWIRDGENIGVIMLDVVSKNVRALSFPENDEAVVAWCTPPLPDTPGAVKAVRVKNWSVTLIMYQELSHECSDVRIAKLEDQPMIFWLDSEHKVSYRSLCY